MEIWLSVARLSPKVIVEVWLREARLSLKVIVEASGGTSVHVQNRLSEAKTDSIIEVTSGLGVKETCGTHPDLLTQF